MIVDFPYTIEDEPTEEWKVEQVLHWWMLRANAESEAEYNKIVEGLSEQLEHGKKELWQAHEEVSTILQKDEVKSGNDENVENQKSISNLGPIGASVVEKPAKEVPSQAIPIAVPVASTRPTRKVAANKASAATATSKNQKPNTIHIEVVGGPYEGKVYDLQPKSRSYTWLGRSTSAKFKDRGISLPLDLEVSTSHGRFEVKGGNFYYVDVASTNGSKLNGEDCEPNHPYELSQKEMTLLVGQTTMKIILLKL